MGLPVGSLSKYVKKLTDLSISFIVLSAVNMDSSADYIYGIKGFKKKCEYVDERFAFNKSNYICDCNKCSFKKTEIGNMLDGYIKYLNKFSNLNNLGHIYVNGYGVLKDNIFVVICEEVYNVQ